MNERETLAAEYALGLLDGERLLEARGLAASDSEFAREVERWQERLAPLLAELGEAAAPEEVWRRIEAEIGGASDKSNVVELRRKLGLWKGLSAAATAIAASLALVVAYDATRPPPANVLPSGGPVMVASLMSPTDEVMLSAACQPDGRTVTLMPGKMRPPSGMAYRLWIIPAEGRPQSLGMVDTDAPTRMIVEADMAPMFTEAAKLALSMEPMDAAPSPEPKGPMVASGELRKV